MYDERVGASVRAINASLKSGVEARAGIGVKKRAKKLEEATSWEGQNDGMRLRPEME